MVMLVVVVTRDLCCLGFGKEGRGGELVVVVLKKEVMVVVSSDGGIVSSGCDGVCVVDEGYLTFNPVDGSQLVTVVRPHPQGVALRLTGRLCVESWWKHNEGREEIKKDAKVGELGICRQNEHLHWQWLLLN